MDVPPEEVELLLEDVDFLCRSANRVVVLDALTERPLERSQLEERTGVSRPTLGRVLGDFEDRNWVYREGREYHTTPVGEFVVDKLGTFLEQMATANTLAPVMRWLPTDGFDFDVRRLRDAEIVYATESDPLAPLRRVESLLRSGTRVRLASYEITVSVLDAMRRATVENDQQLLAVFTPGVYDSIEQEPEMVDPFRTMLEETDAEFLVYRADRPKLVATVDGTTGIGLADDALLRAVLITDDEEVYEWADDLLTRYRERADIVEQVAFSA